MAMDMVRNVKRYSAYVASVILVHSVSVSAAETEFEPFVAAEATFTDNIDQTQLSTESSEITTLSAGMTLSLIGNDGTVALDYSGSQLLYSHDSERNELYNELEFSANKGLFSQTALRADISASIENLARDVREDASADFISGNTVETRNAQLGLSYQSNANKYVDLSTRVNSSLTLNEDEVGDNRGYGADISFNNGNRVKTYFWESEYSYDTNIGQDSDNRSEFHEFDGKLGLQQMGGISPYVRLYAEEYSGHGAGDSADSTTWGPGIRYYLDRNSYAELGYDFALDSGSEDSWNASLYLAPSSRTLITFDYTQRFYGDAYNFHSPTVIKGLETQFRTQKR